MLISAVEPLHSPRGPMSVEAVYLLTPTSQNVDRIIADFWQRRTYKAAHLFFIDGKFDMYQAGRKAADRQASMIDWLAS